MSSHGMGGLPHGGRETGMDSGTVHGTGHQLVMHMKMVLTGDAINVGTLDGEARPVGRRQLPSL